MSKRLVRFVAVVVSALATLAPMRAGAADLTSSVVITPAANALGWHNVPASVTAGFQGSGLVSCVGGIFYLFPDGSRFHGDILQDEPIPIEDCGFAFETSETSIIRGFLTAEQDGTSVVVGARLQVDREEPIVAVDSVPLVSLASPLSGTVQDNFSGPLAVRLHFESILNDQFDAVAQCSGCGTFPDCDVEREPPCGAKVTWTMNEPIPLGIWTVTPYATDLADNQSAGTPVTILAL